MLQANERWCYIVTSSLIGWAQTQNDPWQYDHNPYSVYALQWCHNGCDGISNHQPHDCLLNRLFRRRSKKTSKLHVTSLCGGNSPVTGEFPAQMASNAEKLSFHLMKSSWAEQDPSYICNIFSHWLRSCSAIDRKQAHIKSITFWYHLICSKNRRHMFSPSDHMMGGIFVTAHYYRFFLRTLTNHLKHEHLKCCHVFCVVGNKKCWLRSHNKGHVNLPGDTAINLLHIEKLNTALVSSCCFLNHDAID